MKVKVNMRQDCRGTGNWAIVGESDYTKNNATVLRLDIGTSHDPLIRLIPWTSIAWVDELEES